MTGHEERDLHPVHVAERLASTVFATLLAAGCSCAVGPAPLDASSSTDATSADALTLDAPPGDATLGCGSGLTLNEIETDPAAVLSASRAAVVPGGRLVIWGHGPATPPVGAISFLGDDMTSLEDVPTPWAAGPSLLILDDPSGPVVVATDTEYRWSRFSGAFGTPMPLSLPISGSDESVGDIGLCNEMAAIALLVYRSDGASGVAAITWAGGADVQATAPFYPSDDAYGTWRVTGGTDAPPALQSCLGGPDGVLWVAIRPSTNAAPVLTRVPPGTSAPSTMALGIASGSAMLARGSSGEVSGYVIGADELSAYSLASGAPTLVASAPLPSLPLGSVLIGAQRVGQRSLLLFTNEVGTWAIVLDHDARAFGPAVNLTDLRCESADVFHAGRDGALHLVASCAVGVRGAQLVDLSLCGGP